MRLLSSRMKSFYGKELLLPVKIRLNIIICMVVTLLKRFSFPFFTTLISKAVVADSYTKFQIKTKTCDTCQCIFRIMRLMKVDLLHFILYFKSPLTSHSRE